MNTKTLATQKCRACEGIGDKLKPAQAKKLKSQIKGWKIINNHHLIKTFLFSNFKRALEFVNRTGTISEKEGHHPDIQLSWGKVKIILYTHALNGLSMNDFILAAKINTLRAKKK